MRAGKDPVVLGLSTLHLSWSIFNCFLLLRECLFYVRCSSLLRSTMEVFCNIPSKEKLSCSMKKNYINKAHNFSFLRSGSLPNEPPFSTFSPRSPLLPSLKQCQYYVCSWAKRKESWGLWCKWQKVANEEIDVPCWCSPLKVITETDSHGSLKILEARLRIRCWYSLIMRALHSGCSDTVWLSNGYTWTVTLHSLNGDEAVAFN